MRVVVLFVSRTGNTRSAAEQVGEELALRGCEVAVRPAEGIDYEELAAADLICVGAWVDGAILFGHRPGDSSKLRRLPMLWNKPVAAFMTYAIHSGAAIETFAEFLSGELGAEVIAGQAMRRDAIDRYVVEFVDQIAEALSSNLTDTNA